MSINLQRFLITFVCENPPTTRRTGTHCLASRLGEQLSRCGPVRCSRCRPAAARRLRINVGTSADRSEGSGGAWTPLKHAASNYARAAGGGPGGTRINAQSGVTKSLKTPNSAVTGSPAFEYTSALRSQAAARKLPAFEKRIMELEKLVQQLQEERPKAQGLKPEAI